MPPRLVAAGECARRRNALQHLVSFDGAPHPKGPNLDHATTFCRINASCLGIDDDFAHDVS
jgi:hypothetical protein